MPSALDSREPQKANTIAILQPINTTDIQLIAADISSGMLTCAIVCLDALHVGDQQLAMEPMLTACLDRHLITAPVGTTLVIGPDIEVRIRRHLLNDRPDLADSPLCYEESPGRYSNAYRQFGPPPSVPPWTPETSVDCSQCRRTVRKRASDIAYYCVCGYVFVE